MTSIKNQTVMITGASSGIGAACAELFAKAGARLILVARRESRLISLISRLQEIYPDLESHLLQLDICDRQAVEKSLNNLPEKWRQIDVLVNNAGLAAGRAKIQEAEIDDWEAMIDTNVKGLLYVTRQVLPNMLARNQGYIINIGSIAAHHAYSGGSVYCGTKACVRSISQALRQDICGSGIRVTEIDPGLVETEFSLVRFKGDETIAQNVYQGMTPLTPMDVADTVIYCVNRPAHVNLAEIVLFPTDQAAAQVIHRRAE